VSANGYDTMIKTIHEDFEVSAMIVKRLAQYHAASFYLEKEQVRWFLGLDLVENMKILNLKFRSKS
jgi:hypothetical protein